MLDVAVYESCEDVKSAKVMRSDAIPSIPKQKKMQVASI